MNAIKHIAAEGERWDQLSWRYFADPMGYERILAANARGVRKRIKP